VPTYLSTTDSRRSGAFPLTIHTTHQMSAQHGNLLPSPTTAHSDFSAWPQADSFAPPIPPGFHASFNGASGLAAAPGMSAGWFMPWNMQPPSNGLAMMGVAGFNMPFAGPMSGAGAGPESDGIQDWDTWAQGMRQAPGDERELSRR